MSVRILHANGAHLDRDEQGPREQGVDPAHCNSETIAGKMFDMEEAMRSCSCRL